MSEKKYSVTSNGVIRRGGHTIGRAFDIGHGLDIIRVLNDQADEIERLRNENAAYPNDVLEVLEKQTSRIDLLEQVLRDVHHSLEWQTDDEADENDTSPWDMTAFINGLCRQRIMKVLGE
jgi:hypothetical protein